MYSPLTVTHECASQGKGRRSLGAPVMSAGEDYHELPLPARTMMDEETETLLRLAQGVQEDMMVALLESVQSAATQCATICVQRLACLHKEMLCAMADAEAKHHSGASDLSQTDMVRRNARLSILGQKMFSLGDTDSEDDNHKNEKNGACQKKEGISIEDVYCGKDWEALPTCVESAPTPVKRRQRLHPETFKVTIDKQHWTPVVTNQELIRRLQGLGQKHNLTWMYAVPGSGEIVAKGSHDGIEAVKPELATILLELFPWADLPECLQVYGARRAERLDPEDGKRYTLKGLWDRCGCDYSQDEVWAYWECEMQRMDHEKANGGQERNEDSSTKAQKPHPAQAESESDCNKVPSVPAAKQSVQEEVDPGRGREAAFAKTPGARMLSRGIWAALNNASAPTAQSGSPVAPVSELDIPLDEAYWTPATTSELLPALQRLGRNYGGHLRVAPIMGKNRLFARGSLHILEDAKPKLAALIRRHEPKSTLPQCLQVDTTQAPVKTDPADGRLYTFEALQERYKADYSAEQLQDYWEQEMRKPKL